MTFNYLIKAEVAPVTAEVAEVVPVAAAVVAVV